MSKFIPNSFQLPNAFVDEMLAQVSGNACKVYLLIVRKTRGWQKEKDYISYSQIQKITGISSATVSKAIDELSELGLIKVKTGNEKSANQYSLNDSFCTLKNKVGIEQATLENEVATLENKAQGTLKTKDTENNLSKATNKKAKAKPTQLPNDLSITESQKEKCNSYGLDANFLFDQFKNHHGAKGSEFVNWSMAFNTWINNEIKFKNLQPIEQSYSSVAVSPVVDNEPVKTDPKVLAMIAAKRKGGSHGTA